MSTGAGSPSGQTPSDAEVAERYPTGAVDHDNVAQWRGFLDHRLLINRCDDCGRWSNPPRSRCPGCWSPRVRPRPVTGRGRVQWFTLVFQSPPAPDPATPYPWVVVELEEQPNLRVTSTLVECDPSAIRCDMAVELAWEEQAGAPIPVFRPLAAAGEQGDRARSPGSSGV
jgi:uncharacterized OB-fold protein